MTNNSLVIRNATIVDGTGADPFKGDVALENGIIKEVGTVENNYNDEIDAKGLILAPGFIDIHTHFDPPAMLGWLCHAIYRAWCYNRCHRKLFAFSSSDKKWR